DPVPAAAGALRDSVLRLALPVAGVPGPPAPADAGQGGGRAAGQGAAPDPELRPAPAQGRAAAEQAAALLPPAGHLLLLACRAVPAGKHDPGGLRRARPGAAPGRSGVPA